MSIYCTLWHIKIPVLLPDKPCTRMPHRGVVKEPCREHWFEVYAQAIPGHIKTDYPWLPFPVVDDEETRCVEFVEPESEKQGQEYIDSLAAMSGEDYKKMTMQETVDMLEDLLEARHWPKKGG